MVRLRAHMSLPVDTVTGHISDLGEHARMGLADELEQLQALHGQGALSDDELADAKRRLLSSQDGPQAAQGGSRSKKPLIAGAVATLALLAVGGTALALTAGSGGTRTDAECLEVASTGAEGAEFDAIVEEARV